MRNEGQISQRTFIDIPGFSYCYLMMLKNMLEKIGESFMDQLAPGMV